MDIEGIEEFPDMDFEDRDQASKTDDDEAKLRRKSGDSWQSSLWINPNERDIEDLKKYEFILNYIIYQIFRFG